MRKKFSSSLKLKIALEAIKGDLTISEIVSKYEISPSQIHRWKRQIQQEGVQVFNSTGGPKEIAHEQEITKLHANIGRLTVENNFLERALGRVK
jgi:transposase